MSNDKPEQTSSTHQGTAYQELCTGFRAIDDFRTALLGLLPLASGVGIFLLFGDAFAEPVADLTDPDEALFVVQLMKPIGVFGFVVTLGLFVYELHGIYRCERLIKLGAQIENDAHFKGQFGSYRQEFDIVGKPLAAALIYPAVLASWTFLAFEAFDAPRWPTWTIGVFLVFFSVIPLGYALWYAHNRYKPKSGRNPMPVYLDTNGSFDDRQESHSPGIGRGR